MNYSKVISVLALIVSIASAVAVPLFDIKPVYGIAVGLVAAIAGGLGESLMEATSNKFLTGLGLVVAASAAIINYSEVQKLLSPEALSFITHAGAIAAALGKGITTLPGIPTDPE